MRHSRRSDGYGRYPCGTREDPTTAAVIHAPLSKIRRLRPLSMRHSRRSDDYGRYPCATREDPTTAAVIHAPLAKIRRLRPLSMRHSRRSDDNGRYTCATREDPTTTAAIHAPLAKIRRLPLLYFCDFHRSLSRRPRPALSASGTRPLIREIASEPQKSLADQQSRLLIPKVISE